MSLNMESFEETNLKFLSNNMAINLDVLGALMIDRVHSNVESSLIITKKKCWTTMRNTQVF